MLFHRQNFYTFFTKPWIFSLESPAVQFFLCPGPFFSDPFIHFCSVVPLRILFGFCTYQIQNGFIKFLAAGPFHSPNDRLFQKDQRNFLIKSRQQSHRPVSRQTCDLSHYCSTQGSVRIIRIQRFLYGAPVPEGPKFHKPHQLLFSGSTHGLSKVLILVIDSSQHVDQTPPLLLPLPFQPEMADPVVLIAFQFDLDFPKPEGKNILFSLMDN